MGKNIDDDPFVNPDALKDDKSLIDALKESEGMRWPGIFFLMGLTLAIGLIVGFFILQNNGYLELELARLATVDEFPPNPIPLGQEQIETNDGQFTEWYVTNELSEKYPVFIDADYHPQTGRVFLVANDQNLYWIDSDRTGIYFEDIGTRLGSTTASISAVKVVDQDRLILITKFVDPPIVIYNVKNNRVEQRFGTMSENGEPGTFDRIDEKGLEVGPDGSYYLMNYFQRDDAYLDEIIVFNSEGQYVKEIPFEKGIEDFAIRQDGHIFVIQDFETLFQLDQDGNVVGQIERDAFRFVNDMAFDEDGNLFLAKPFDSWFVEIQPDQEFGFISSESVEFGADSWDLGQASFIRNMTFMPNENQFLIIDGNYKFQRLFVFEPNR
ncbi:MAG: hypothetical protein AAGD96_28875 [Chloroflexota bacterium]